MSGITYTSHRKYGTIQKYHHLLQLKDYSALVVKLKLLDATDYLMHPSNNYCCWTPTRKLILCSIIKWKDNDSDLINLNNLLCDFDLNRLFPRVDFDLIHPGRHKEWPRLATSILPNDFYARSILIIWDEWPSQGVDHSTPKFTKRIYIGHAEF